MVVDWRVGRGWRGDNGNNDACKGSGKIGRKSATAVEVVAAKAVGIMAVETATALGAIRSNRNGTGGKARLAEVWCDGTSSGLARLIETGSRESLDPVSDTIKCRKLPAESLAATSEHPG